MRCCRTITRQTTHHHPLPEQVTVIRACHALEGKVVTVLGQHRRGGRRYLLLAPPDTDPVLIPADWTDFGTREHSADIENRAVSPSAPACTPGSIANLMRMRTVVDGLLRCLSGTGTANQQRLDTEGTGATDLEILDPAAPRNPARPARTRTARRTCPDLRRDHCQDSQPNRTADGQPDRNNEPHRGDKP